MKYSTPNTRSTQWTHSGIQFMDRGEIIAVVLFPCGPQGPIDGSFGSPERKHWHQVVESWIDHAMLPDNAYFPRGLDRCEYSKTFNLEVR